MGHLERFAIFRPNNNAHIKAWAFFTTQVSTCFLNAVYFMIQVT